MTDKTKARITIVKCKGCGVHSVYINEYRLTAHKACIGEWETIREEVIDTADVRKSIQRAPRNDIISSDDPPTEGAAATAGRRP